MKKIIKIIISIICLVLAICIGVYLFTLTPTYETLENRSAQEQWNLFCEKIENGEPYTITSSLGEDSVIYEKEVSVELSKLDLSQCFSSGDIAKTIHNENFLPTEYRVSYFMYVKFQSGYEAKIVGIGDKVEIKLKTFYLEMENQKLYHFVQDLALKYQIKIYEP